MTTEMLILCYSARPSPNGELHILGATDIIFVPQFPIGITCSLVAKLRFRKFEEGLKEIRFSIIDSDGKPVLPEPPPQSIDIQITTGASSGSAAIVVGISNLQIPHAGEYEIGLTVNGRQEMTVPLFVRQPPATPSSQAL
jgi:hypothetical protein